MPDGSPVHAGAAGADTPEKPRGSGESPQRLPRGFHILIGAQFCSALADNALLIVTMAMLAEQQRAAWLAPLLKFAFTIAYVVLAPFVGALADAFPKGRLMAVMNAVKVAGVGLLLLGVHPLAAFAVVGLGAAAYAPAKYGLVTELVAPQRLVAANGWIEVSVVFAALFGTMLGGLLASNWLLQAPGWGALNDQLGALLPPAGPGVEDSAYALSLAALLSVYAAAALLNIGVPASGAKYARAAADPLALLHDFRAANRRLWRDADGGLSLAVTTLFWGVGATLQFAVLGWATGVLGLTLDHAAYLQAAVALGVIGGAGYAGWRIALADAKRMLPAGVLLGLLVTALALTRDLGPALPLLVAAGVVGGLLVVPLNALLQHRGHVLLTAGRSIAVQGFNENLSVLAMLALYAGLLASGLPLVGLMAGFGLAIAGAMLLVIGWQRRLAARPGQQPAAGSQTA